MLYVLPDSAGDILVIQATEHLSQSDYDDVFLPQIKKQLKPNHSLRILLYLDHHFKNVDSDSNWQPELFFKACEANIIRMAIVGDESRSFPSEDFGSNCVKHYNVSGFLNALHWLDEGDI